jgi:hypothetical protein
MDRQGDATPINDWVKRKNLAAPGGEASWNWGAAPSRDHQLIPPGMRDAEAKGGLGHRIVTLLDTM